MPPQRLGHPLPFAGYLIRPKSCCTCPPAPMKSPTYMTSLPYTPQKHALLSRYLTLLQNWTWWESQTLALAAWRTGASSPSGKCAAATSRQSACRIIVACVTLGMSPHTSDIAARPAARGTLDAFSRGASRAIVQFPGLQSVRNDLSSSSVVESWLSAVCTGRYAAQSAEPSPSVKRQSQRSSSQTQWMRMLPHPVDIQTPH